MTGSPRNVDKKDGNARPVFWRRQEYRFARAQGLATLVATAVAFGFDPVVAYSIFLGGVVCFVPGAFAAFRMSIPTADANQAVMHVFMAEGGKFLLTCVLLVAIFVRVDPLNELFFIGTIGVLHLAYVLVPLSEKYKQDSK